MDDNRIEHISINRADNGYIADFTQGFKHHRMLFMSWAELSAWFAEKMDQPAAAESSIADIIAERYTANQARLGSQPVQEQDTFCSHVSTTPAICACKDDCCCKATSCQFVDKG